jgi:hypothetical protein
MMSELVGVQEAVKDSGGRRKTYEIGDEVYAPSTVQEQFDTDGIVRGTITEFEDEGHRISAKCVSDPQNLDGTEKYYIHFTVGNLQKLFYHKEGGSE